jgi:hypothetical protein
MLKDKGKIIFNETKKSLLNNWKKIEFQDKNILNFIDKNNFLYTKSKKENYYSIVVSNYNQEIEKELKKYTIKNMSITKLSLEEIFLEYLNNKNENYK